MCLCFRLAAGERSRRPGSGRGRPRAAPHGNGTEGPGTDHPGHVPSASRPQARPCPRAAVPAPGPCLLQPPQNPSSGLHPRPCQGVILTAPPPTRTAWHQLTGSCFLQTHPEGPPPLPAEGWATCAPAGPRLLWRLRRGGGGGLSGCRGLGQGIHRTWWGCGERGVWGPWAPGLGPGANAGGQLGEAAVCLFRGGPRRPHRTGPWDRDALGSVHLLGEARGSGPKHSKAGTTHRVGPESLGHWPHLQ